MKYKRAERIAIITKILTENPNKVFTLNCFTDRFNSSKSTISEDMMIIKDAINNFELGNIETIAGSAGGIKYKVKMSEESIKAVLEDFKGILNDSSRILPGEFLYMTDIIFLPKYAKKVGEIFATKFNKQEPEYIVTLETKGIPLAMMTAKALNVPLVIVRRDSKVTEGSFVSINYVSGSTKRIQTMSLSKKSIKEGSKVLIIDDFMKGGGSARGLIDLMKEFNVTPVGIGVLISTKNPTNKLVDDYYSLLTLNHVDPSKGEIDITVSG